MTDPIKVARDLRDRHRSELRPSGHIGLIRAYVRGDYTPYMPPGATPEFRKMAHQSRTPWLGLIVDTFAKGLFVDGYRGRDGAPQQVWDWWQANQMDARQSIAHRTALKYGEAYVLASMSDNGPVIRPLRVTDVAAGWSDPDAQWPDYLLVRTPDGYALYDDETCWSLSSTADKLDVSDAEEHGFAMCPAVRFRTDLDDDSLGIVKPLIPLQQRIDATVFATQIAIHYAAFRQRWATGLVLPIDKGTGEKVAPFKASVDRVWSSEDPATKFGDFQQTDIQGHLAAYLSGVRTLTALAQAPPTIHGELVNLSAEALAATYDSTLRRIEELQTVFGESWEQVLRLAAQACGDLNESADTAAQVMWRDTEARALASTVDALGKLAQMLNVPVEALWKRVPGVTEQDVAEWVRLAEQGRMDEAVATARSFGLPGLDSDAQPTG